MEPTWIVVADGASAQLLEVRNLLKPAVPFEVLENPQGRMKASDLLTDHAPRNAPPETVSETVMQRFAKTIAMRLEQGRIERRFEHLVLVCAPAFLGVLRDALPKETGRRVISSHAKDLSREANIGARVQQMVRDAIQFTV